MAFKAALFLVLLVAAAGERVYTEPAAASVAGTTAPTAAEPTLEVVEDPEPAVEEPAAEKPVIEEPTVEEPVVEEPAVEEPAVVEPAVEEPAVQQQSYGYQQPAYGHRQPAYGHHQQAYGHHQPAYGHHQPANGHHQPAYGKTHEPADPACSKNTTKAWCLEDSEYPSYQIAQAISYDHYTFLSLYQDVVANTSNSVDRLETLEEETYLCSSQTSYVQPLRARNTDGKWRVIVNNVQVHYDTFTQTARVEECLSAGEPCPLVPRCYQSSCLQKSVYHRFLVYDAYDYYQPFALETFKLPSACACSLGAYEITH